ncbi:MAG: hypothetical protein AAB528_02685, partial [Chloroflexota bacterium]
QPLFEGKSRVSYSKVPPYGMGLPPGSFGYHPESRFHRGERSGAVRGDYPTPDSSPASGGFGVTSGAGDD